MVLPEKAELNETIDVQMPHLSEGKENNLSVIAGLVAAIQAVKRDASP